jgi:hypothetical protein
LPRLSGAQAGVGLWLQQLSYKKIMMLRSICQSIDYLISQSVD